MREFRIEGSHTTLADYVESAVEGRTQDSGTLCEISNIEEAMQYIERTVEPGSPLSERFMRELHSMAAWSVC